MPILRNLGNLARRMKHGVRQAAILGRYRRGIEPTHAEWESLMQLHCLTNGASTQKVRRAMARLRPAPAAPAQIQSLFGPFDTAAVQAAADRIRTDGFYVFPGVVPADICDEIAANVRSYKGWTWRDQDGAHPVAQFDPENLTAPRYDLPEQEIWKIKPYQRIASDPLFVNLARAYFNSEAALKELGLWWSPGLGRNQADSDAAQMFHFDYDAAPVWLKFFVYLNDVGPENGPHVFVRGSHHLGLDKSRDILSRGYVRITDAEIETTFGPENVLEMTGRKGTVFAVDTMGFHKGKLPWAGHRLLAQLEFASPLFVPIKCKPQPIPADMIPELRAARAAYPDVHARFPVAT